MYNQILGLEKMRQKKK